MATVTGSLMDLGLTVMPGLHPEITFTADPGVDGGTIVAGRPVVVIPAADGAFSVNLWPTTTLRPATYYRITVRWLDAAGNFIGMSEIPAYLYVSDLGGVLGDLLVTSGAPGMTWYGLEPPPIRGPFTSWLRVDPNNPDDYTPETGDLYEWS